jgi:hypothetical protein
MNASSWNYYRESSNFFLITWQRLIHEKDRNFTAAVKYISSQAQNHVATIASTQYALAAASKSGYSTGSTDSKSHSTPVEPSMIINGIKHHFCFAHEGLKPRTGWGPLESTHSTSTCRFIKRNIAAQVKKASK